MRKLIMKRKKSVIGCAMRVFVCTETEKSGDFNLGLKRLEKRGTLRSGETCSFEIPEEGGDVYVVYSKTMPQSFHTKYTVGTGTEDVRLYTSPRFNPFKGNPFGITTSETVSKEDIQRIKREEQKRGSTTGYKVLMISSVVVGAILGFWLSGFLF